MERADIPRQQIDTDAIRKRVVLWDFDGPIFKNAEINNLPVLSATLEILSANGVTSIVASQRSTFGYAKTKILEALNQVLEGNASLLKADWNMLSKLFDLEFKSFNKSNELNNIVKCKNLLVKLASGQIIASDLNPEDMKLVKQVRDILKFNLVGEITLREEMYSVLNDSFKPGREFLKRTDAESIGQKIAFSMKTDETGNSKSMYVDEIVDSLKLDKNQVYLIDDADIYVKSVANGCFIHAPRISDNFHQDNCYLGEVLLKTSPLDKLSVSFAEYKDKELANNLKSLVIFAYANDFKSLDKRAMDRLVGFIINILLAEKKVHTELSLKYLFDLQESVKFDFPKYFIDALLKKIDNHPDFALNDKRKLIVELASRIINTSTDNIFISDFVERVDAYHCMQQENSRTGVFGLFGSSQGKTSAQKAIIACANERVLVNKGKGMKLNEGNKK